jgi:serine phosphatase RsbU (regulator of sigma subunit)/anti-sigma regulatory factor (Ser/Thr protein kinase)
VSTLETEAAHTAPARSAGRRYAVAGLIALGSLVVSLLVMELAEAPIYAPVVGAVAISAVYGGLGPALVAVAVGLGAGFVVLADPPGSIALDDQDHVTRWAVNLAVGLAIAWVTVALRRGRERASTAVRTVQESVRELQQLQALTTALSAAVTPSDVAHALLEEMPSLVGARGGALGLIDGDELEIVDPRGVSGQTHQPGFRLRLASRAPIAEVARTGTPVVVRGREAFERSYPDGAALTLYAHGAVAVPLRVAGEVVGSMSLLFDEGAEVPPGAESLATLAAELGGQALERARLYERELESRRSLDRILMVAARFHADTVEAATAAICIEGRTTFGADLVTLWRMRDGRMVLEQSDPRPGALEPGLEARLDDFPRLSDAVARGAISFVPDLLEEASGEGLERVRRLGIRSSLRTPVVFGGTDTDRVLVCSWLRVVTDPDPSTLALVRRFTDQAGLALEQVERRLAEEEARRRAEETRRLQEITAALAVASSVADVSTTCLEHALESVGADAGFVVLTHPEKVVVDVIAGKGYADAALARWAAFALDDDVPFARAISSGEPVWALAEDELAGFGVELGEDRGWVALPLKTVAGVRGALHLAFRRPRELGDDERRWLQTLVSQCAQALERSRLFDAELLLRQRSERLQGLTAALSNALTRADVASVVVEEVAAAVGAEGAALVGISGERGSPMPLASRGYADEEALPWLEVSPDGGTPASRAVRRRSSSFFATPEDLASEFPALATDVDRSSHASFLFVPLVAGRQVNALLALSWETPYVLMSEDRRFVESLAGQAADALDRATSFETEQTIAETLQRSVLPATLPELDGVDLAARYLPGTAELDVGGDWYDAIPLADGRLGLVVGDVVGKGVQAAATMSQLRNALRAFSLDRLKPSSAVARLNRLADEVVDTAFATVVYVVVDPVTGIVRFTCAGHPPPVVAYPDGRVELLEGGRGLPLGAAPDASYSHGVAELPAGSVLLLYTDGLVERRDRPIDEGLSRLCEAVREGPREPGRLVEHVVSELIGTADRGDDIALLAVRLLTVAPRPLHVRVPSDAASLDLVRDAVRTWVAGTTLTPEDARAVVLAVWEACANAVEHATHPNGDHVDVRGEVTEDGVRLVVDDTGAWKDPTARVDRGLGLELMRATMTSVDVSPGSAGTRVTLEKASSAAGEPR